MKFAWSNLWLGWLVTDNTNYIGFLAFMPNEPKTKMWNAIQQIEINKVFEIHNLPNLSLIHKCTELKFLKANK